MQAAQNQLANPLGTGNPLMNPGFNALRGGIGK